MVFVTLRIYQCSITPGTSRAYKLIFEVIYSVFYFSVKIFIDSIYVESLELPKTQVVLLKAYMSSQDENNSYEL